MLFRSLYIKIKDEYAASIRFKDSQGAITADVYSLLWKINPIYLVKPTVNSQVYITYDGNEHSVYEVLQGYSAENPSEAITWLMKNVRLSLEGSRSVNAGTFTAVFSLPNGNYAWTDADGNVDPSADSVNISWTIQKYVIDLSEVKWNYDEENQIGRASCRERV